MPEWLAGITIAQIIGAVIGIGTLYVIGRQVWSVLRPVREFTEDWKGEPSRPGVPARPGVMERLATTERAIQQLAEIQKDTHRIVTRLEGQLAPNGGSSARDSLDRIEQRLDAITDPPEEAKNDDHPAVHAVPEFLRRATETDPVLGDALGGKRLEERHREEPGRPGMVRVQQGRNER